MSIWNAVATQLLAAQPRSISESARILALLAAAGHDAGVACWEAKYYYNFWRPQAAIAAGGLDGNAATEPEPGWTPLVPTPPHPEYVSGHSVNSTAMATILQLAFGDEPGVPMVLTIAGVTREWTTLSEAIAEVIEARIYSGIHFRTADEVGARQGRQVAQFVYTHGFRPQHGKR